MTMFAPPASARSPAVAHCRRRAAGLTLAELLVVLVIAAILLSLALPALGGMVRAYQLRLAATDFLGAVDLTRSEALALGQRVMLAPTAATLDWADGWTVFVDRNGDRRPNAGDDIIMRHPALASSSAAAAISFTMNFGTQQGPPYLAYNSAGRGCSHLSSLTSRFGTMTLAQGEQRRRIKINMQGRARLCDPHRDGAACAGGDP